MNTPTATPSIHKLSVSQLSLYNPARLSDEDIVASFAARQAAFERILADIVAEKPRSRAQHHLIVGQRGMGKSTLLARIAAELRQKPELSMQFTPLVFAEEQYAVDRLSKFWLNCLDSLADACERSGNVAATDRIDYAVRQLSSRLGVSTAQDEGPAAEALDAFLAEAKALERRPVLLVDNLQLVFERLSQQQQHVLRELLMRPGGPLLVGASPSPPPESQDYGAAFYDHFKVHYLPPLSVDEMRQLMLTLAEKVGRTDVRDRVLQHPHRLNVLRQLTGGNPRTTVTLFFLYAEDFAPSVFGDLENLLDRVTPLYKARFEELSAQQQVIASAVANHWDPVTARALTDATGLPITGISPQLDRLEKTGFIERVSLFGESAIGFQIAERFFNVWFLMRSASRRQRREVEFLTRFIESFYEAQDRSRLARYMQTEHDLSPDRHLFARALACTINETDARDLRRHVELDALRQEETEARRKLEEVIDFSKLPPATLAFTALRNKIVTLVPTGAGIEPALFADKVLGDRQMFLTKRRDRLASRVTLSAEEVQKLVATVGASRSGDEDVFGKDAVAWLSWRLSSGQLATTEDLEDWNAAFRQAPDSKATQLLLETVPPEGGFQLPEDVISKVREHLRPKTSGTAFEWREWGRQLHKILGRADEAEAAYRKAIELSQKDAWAWDCLGRLLQSLNRIPEAESAYRTAAACDNRNSWPLLHLGELLQVVRRYEEAEVVFRDAINRDSTNIWPQLELGRLHQVLGRLDEAEADYRGAIAGNPENPWPHFDLSVLLANRDQLELAEASLQNAIKLDPDIATFWDALGGLHVFLKRFTEAAAEYSKAHEIAPAKPKFMHALTVLRRDFLGEGVSALQRFQEFLARLQTRPLDVIELQHALFAAYAENWGMVRDAMTRALSLTESGIPHETSGMWLHTSAVLLHLNCGEQLLTFLRERGDQARLRPWYEALAALHAGDRRHLQNLAPEIRVTAESYFDQIEERRNALPEKTRRRPLPAAVEKAARRRHSRR